MHPVEADLRRTQGEKGFRHDTHRICAPAETLARIRPLCSELGITRVANVTGLDRIGIPVFMVVRPNSRSLAVSQGKGADVDSARVSGLMESIETHHAEFTHCTVRLESHAVLRRQVAVADPEQLPRPAGSRFTSDLSLPWVEGYDLLGQEPVWVPYEMVHLNYTLPFVADPPSFDPSSNGLASGNDLLEAVCHGLAEILERDASARFSRLPHEEQSRARIDLGTVDYPVAAELLGKLDRAGVATAAWAVGLPGSVPACQALIFEPECDPVLRPLAAAEGFGAHPDSGVALCRALAEAAQGRLTAIAGARDDFFRANYRSFQSAEALEHNRARVAPVTAGLAFGSLPSPVTDTLSGDLDVMLQAAKLQGATRVIVCDLSRRGLPISVARVIAPGLEGCLEHRSHLQAGAPVEDDA